MRKRRTKKKVVVIWVDAGTFNVINPMLKEGKLPTFQKLIKEGPSGELMSTMPPLTPPAWASFVTGVNPGKHGVYDFWHMDGNKMTSVTSYSIPRETLWSMLNEADKKVMLINAPMTYPPRKVNGVVVTGLITPGNIPYTYPENLRRALLREVPEYRVYTQTEPYVNEALYLEEAHALLRARRDATLYLMKNYDWDLLVSAFYYTDQIQHVFWKYMDPTHPAHNPDAPKRFKEAIAEAYKIVDDAIEKILRTIDEDAMLIVMSDHGAGPIYKYVFVNNYLRKVGVMKMSREGAIKLTLDNFLKAFGIREERLPYVLRYLKGSSKALLNRLGAVEESSYSVLFSKSVDWSQTKAYSVGHFGQIFVNRALMKRSQEYESLINYLILKLYQLKDPESGQRVVDKVFRKSQIYWGQYVNNAPDLLFIMRNMTYITWAEHEFASNQIVEPSLASADHRMEGILFMYGKDVRKGSVLKDPNIMDLAPTILYALGLQPPSDVDGKVLADAFHPAYLRKHQVKLREKMRKRVAAEKYRLSKEDELKIKERLKALGYLG